MTATKPRVILLDIGTHPPFPLSLAASRADLRGLSPFHHHKLSFRGAG